MNRIETKTGIAIVVGVVVIVGIVLYVLLGMPQHFDLPGTMPQGFVVDTSPTNFGSKVFDNVGLDNQDAFDYVEYESAKTPAEIKASYDDFFTKNNWTIQSEGGDDTSGYAITATTNDPSLGYVNAVTTQASVTIVPMATSTKVMISYFHAQQGYYEAHTATTTQNATTTQK